MLARGTRTLARARGLCAERKCSFLLFISIVYRTTYALINFNYDTTRTGRTCTSFRRAGRGNKY